MKNILKNKKLLIGLAVAIILIIIIVVVILVIRPKDENQELEEVTNNYVTYISINPSIKLEFSQTCQKNDSILDCTDPEVIDYELLNADAKEIYQDIDLLENDKKLLTVIDLIIKTAESNNIEFETVDIYSDWEQMNNFVNENLESENFTYNVIINSKDNLSEIEDALINDIVTYVVTFDTDGGSEILSQTIKENELVIEPLNPTRNGYTFVEWQLDGERFDFETPIIDNITLIAIWEQVSNNPSNSNDELDNNQSGNENQNNDSNQSIDNSNDNNNQNDDIVNDNIVDNNETTNHDNMINLNENVKYKISTLECGEYMYINPVCVNKSIGELKSMFPNHNADSDIFNDSFFDDSYVFSTVNLYGGAHMLVGAFPDCRMGIPANIQNEIKNLKSKGIIYNVTNDKVEPQWISFEEFKYTKYTDDRSVILGRYSLFDNAACGSSDPVIYPNILDEKVCEEYNLSCGRW